MDVRAVFELPAHVWVMREALGQTFPTGYGQLQFNVVMPQDGDPVGAPAIEGVADHPQLAGEDVHWAIEHGAFIAESLQPAVALYRIAITDVTGPTYEHKSWFTPEAQLAEYISAWFDDVRTWVEMITGQDLDPNHRVYDAELVGEGLTFIEPPSEGPAGLRLTTPRVRPLRAAEWAGVLQLVSQGKEIPLEEQLSRDARAAQRRGADRRAVIEAATALEIVLGRYVREHADELPEKQRKRIDDETSLGKYISIVEASRLKGLAVPVDQLKWLNKLRNDAAHRGLAPSNWDAGDAVQVMINFLGTHGKIRRTGEVEPDGSEWIVAD